jgi:transposase-like protein
MNLDDTTVEIKSDVFCSDSFSRRASDAVLPLKELTRSLVNTAIEAELSHHLGYEPGPRPPPQEANRRNGKSEKTVRAGHGSVPIEVPLDRVGSFSPKLIPKRSRQFQTSLAITYSEMAGWSDWI